MSRWERFRFKRRSDGAFFTESQFLVAFPVEFRYMGVLNVFYWRIFLSFYENWNVY